MPPIEWGCRGILAIFVVSLLPLLDPSDGTHSVLFRKAQSQSQKPLISNEKKKKELFDAIRTHLNEKTILNENRTSVLESMKTEN